MPFTFFAHQAVVIPLKWARPRWFDGVALCIGSMAPDFAYAFSATPFEFASHTLGAQFYWGVPITLLFAALFRRVVAGPLADHLRDPLAGEVRTLMATSHPLAVTLASALIGSLSHYVLDGFTHVDGWVAMRVAWLRLEVLHGVTVAKSLQYAGHTAGSAIGLALFASLVNRRRLTAWAAPIAVAKETPRPSRAFWPIALASALLACAVGVASLAGITGLSVALIRGAWMIGAGFVLAGWNARNVVQP